MAGLRSQKAVLPSHLRIAYKRVGPSARASRCSTATNPSVPRINAARTVYCWRGSHSYPSLSSADTSRRPFGVSSATCSLCEVAAPVRSLCEVDQATR